MRRKLFGGALRIRPPPSRTGAIALVMVPRVRLCTPVHMYRISRQESVNGTNGIDRKLSPIARSKSLCT